MSALQDYNKALEAYHRGDRKASAELLSKALGSEEKLPAVENSLDSLVKPNEVLADGVLRLMGSRKK